MRKQLCDALLARSSDSDMIFMTGDLGFMALEALQSAMGERFINAGVAEQNMVSVAAGLSRQGFDVWVYSIAPFCYARPFEQIRNDVTFHGLPVHLIGNGGGYGYGVMGPTHHAIEDYGILLTLPNMRVFVPVFDEDIAPVIAGIGKLGHSTYLRLGRGEAPAGYVVPPYAPWRQLLAGDGPAVIAVGPLAGTYIEALGALPEARRPNLWALAELPLGTAPPPALMANIAERGEVFVAEEHVAHGSFASELSMYMLRQAIFAKVHHLCARAHQYPKYGSQGYMRAQSGLDPQSLLSALAAR